jgi:hypothetical protein
VFKIIKIKIIGSNSLHSKLYIYGQSLLAYDLSRVSGANWSFDPTHSRALNF